MPLRIYLTGRICVESAGVVVDERLFPGNQGRLALAFLAIEHRHPVTHDELAECLWPGDLPNSWERSVSAIVSKLRSILTPLIDTAGELIPGAVGCYQLRLPPDVWIDVEAVEGALEQSRSAVRSGAYRTAYGWALAAYMIAKRPFLAGESAPWVASQRAQLRVQLVQAIDLLAEIFTQIGEFPMALKFGEEVLLLEPYHETGYQQLMRAHVASGNRAEALRVYERCRKLLIDELGVGPSAQTEAVYSDVLRSSP